MNKYLSVILVVLALFITGLFFSYRILETPPGITVDEAAFGYNAVLLAETAHDQNGRFMPVFVLSINGGDWRQPVSQYYLTAIFKLFSPSLLSLRLSTVAVLLTSAYLTYFWLSKVLDKKAGLIGSLVFLTTPLVMIQTHMALDNIFPVPFTLLWLIFLWYFSKTKSLKYLVLAGISLGINFYTYKAMRATVPIWCLLTTVYLFRGLHGRYTKKDLQIFFKRTLFFCLGVLPFFAIIPLLEQKYPGAVFNSQGFKWTSVYDFLYPYLSSFDPSFLFIRGDETVYHSTGVHGMLLLSTLPFFLIGLYRAVQKRGFWTFFIAVFLATPLLFGFVNSVHRASRLMAFIPPFVAITTLGLLSLWEIRNKLLHGVLIVSTIIMFAINYFDFVNYYWYTYPKFVSEHFLPANSVEDAYKYLSQVSAKNSLTPYIEVSSRKADGETGNFLEAAYFDQVILRWQPGDSLPVGSILMAKLEHQPKMKTIGNSIHGYYFFLNEEENIIDL